LKVYTPCSPDQYELCHPVNQDDFEIINAQLNGELRHRTWKPIAVRLIREDEGRKLRPSDSPWLGSHALIFNAAAIDALGPLLRVYGELLPLSCKDAQLSVFNPTRVVDALDEEASSVLRFSDGRIMRVNRYIFDPEPIRGVYVFKIRNLRVSPTFVGQHFVDWWNEAGLEGLEFRMIWSEAQ
jgi:hypothetical protein